MYSHSCKAWLVLILFSFPTNCTHVVCYSLVDRNTIDSLKVIVLLIMVTKTTLVDMFVLSVCSDLVYFRMVIGLERILCGH